MTVEVLDQREIRLGGGRRVPTTPEAATPAPGDEPLGARVDRPDLAETTARRWCPAHPHGDQEEDSDDGAEQQEPAEARRDELLRRRRPVATGRSGGSRRQVDRGTGTGNEQVDDDRDEPEVEQDPAGGS